ncbi:putative ABC-class ATPase [Allonocardiopsis opalescens]|uniref:Putative ABC-class ATPase n=1 Tax=Allonocardiopsis opalescens TaxID=1144618 RepID=A0A2T0Q086_9ACTN|nr:putative ABC-class ATPase [Allonocardiopsis opalescens]
MERGEDLGAPSASGRAQGGGDAERLRAALLGMDGSGYGRYRSLTGRWRFDGFELAVEHVQADPYAPPSRLSLEVPASVAGFDAGLWRDPVRARALADLLARRAAEALAGSRFRVDAGGQEVLARSACAVREGAVRLRFAVELPGHGRRIAGREAARQLCELLPAAVASSLRAQALPAEEVRAFADTVSDSVAAREQLAERGLVAFVADGSVLPRRSGVSDLPLTGPGAVPFAAPEPLRVELELPHRGRVAGMGVPEGITLIVGGGFHGKSTLLHALERGVYDHVPGDGRELVVTRADAVKIRAEEGRRVERTDISAFVGELPSGADTRDFRTDNASGSTSQAAAIVEAVEAGARVLLVDEDTTATNLMIRDARMQALVAPDREPLTPFVDLVRPLRRSHGVSCVLVMGASGDYFDVADQVVLLDAYRPHDVTAAARALAAPRDDAPFPAVAHRAPDPGSISAQARGRRRIKGRGTDALVFGETEIDLRALEQLVDPSQVPGLGLALTALVRRGHLDGHRTLAAALDLLDAELAEGPDALDDGYLGDFAPPRRHDTAAALNRLRTLRVARQSR